jgi:hypothetical protein
MASLNELVSLVREDYSRGNALCARAWAMHAIKLVHMDRFSSSQFQILEPEDAQAQAYEVVERLLSDLNRIEEVRPLIRGRTEIDGVQTKAGVSPEGRWKVGKKTLNRVCMLIALDGILEMLGIVQRMFRNVEGDVYRDHVLNKEDGV